MDLKPQDIDFDISNNKLYSPGNYHMYGKKITLYSVRYKKFILNLKKEYRQEVREKAYEICDKENEKRLRDLIQEIKHLI